MYVHESSKVTSFDVAEGCYYAKSYDWLTGRRRTTNVPGKFLLSYFVHTNTTSQWHMSIISLRGAKTLMIVTQANKLNLKIRKVEIFHYTYRYTVLFNTKRPRERRRWTPVTSVLVRFKLARVFILHRPNFNIYCGRCLATFRKNTLPQISTRLHGVITRKTTVSNLHHRQPSPPPPVPITSSILSPLYIYTWLLVRLSNIKRSWATTTIKSRVRIWTVLWLHLGVQLLGGYTGFATGTIPKHGGRVA